MSARWREARSFFEQSILLETDECILWPYSITRDHGMVRIGRSMVYVSAEALRRRVGPTPEGKPNSLHSCASSLCFNYRHLYWGDQWNNHQDQIREGTFTTRFTKDEIHWIRRQRYLGVPNAVIASHLKVPRETIKNITSDYRYSWIPKIDPSTKLEYEDIHAV